MKALLVYPEFPDTYWSFRHALKFEGKRSAFPPLGLMTVAAMLPANWQRRLVDMNVEPLRRADIEWADIVFASAMLVQKDSLRAVVQQCKLHGKPVAVGGPYVTTTCEDLPADYLFFGESEETLPRFIEEFTHGGATERIYASRERPSLELTPVPEFNLVDLRRYVSMSVQYSRGCPFRCEFCDIIEIYGRVPRTKSPAQMLAELDALRATGWRGSVFIVDDSFIGNKRNVKRLLPELAEWQQRHRYPFSLFTEASVNLAEDDELLEMMRRAGFRRVFLGIETPVKESLAEAQKGQNLQRDLLDAVRKIQSYGMEVMAGFIVGFDHDPPDIFDRQIEFIRESAIPLAMVGLLHALPGTQLWRRLEREGRLLGESSGNNTDCSLNFIPRMDVGQLIDGYKRILQTIYSPTEYYNRALECLKRLAYSGLESRHNELVHDLAALVRLVFELGIRDRARASFWHYVARTLAACPQRFAHAMTLAAMGYHFRKLTESYLGQSASPDGRPLLKDLGGESDPGGTILGAPA